MNYEDPRGLQYVFENPVLDIEKLIGVAGWEGSALLLDELDRTDIETKDTWIIVRAAEIGYEVGQRSPTISQ